ncbi:MAG: outer membrane lipoprotein-sorting protein [Treponema sp.]|nr:outer membrane lipoprotein-sorting protein [Treponema sp.]
MKRTNILKAGAVCMALAAGSGAFAQDGRAILQKVLDVKEPDFTHALVTMELIEKDGTVSESRTVEEYGRSKDGLASLVMVFKSPASVKDTRFLQVENSGKADDKWIYLPALRTTRRVAASQGSQSFMGTDVTYDDMSTRELDDDTHELLGEETKNGFSCWKIKSTPVNASTSQYQYRIQWIDKNTSVPIYAEMYDKKGNLIKVLTVEKLENISGYDIPTVDVLKNVQTGHATRLVISKIVVDKPIPDRVFTESFLNTGK